MTGMVLRLLASLAALLVLAAPAISAPAPISALAGPSAALDLGQADQVPNATPYVSFLIDRERALSIESFLDNDTERALAGIDKKEPNFGFEKSPIWLRLKLRNSSSVPLERILVMRTNFVTEIDVWHAREGEAAKILEQELASPFSSRPIDYHQLAAPLQLAPESESTVWIRYRTTGLTALPISIETNMSFTARSNREMARNFAFYGVMVMLIFASLTALIITRARIFLWYLLYAGFVTLYIFHRDGYAFQLFWREYGLWNSYASLPLAGVLTIFAAQFTRAYLSTQANMRMFDKLLIGVIIFQATTIIASALFDSEVIKQMMTVSIPISAVVFLSAGIAALIRKGVSVLAFVLGWSGIVAASAVTFIAHWIDFEVTRAATLDTMRTAMVFDAIMMAIACVGVVMEWRRERENLMQDRLAATERNARLQSRLALVEQRHATAQSAVESSNRLVADTTHDLRQPLMALRSSILKMSTGPTPDAEELSQIEASLAYMESLVEQNLLQAVEGSNSLPASDQKIPVQRILDAVATIFAEDAQAAGISLRVAKTTAALNGDTPEVLRILSNLVGNAIAYSGGERILVGARRRDGGLQFEVFDDGKGMNARQILNAKMRCERGGDAKTSRPEGKGLGLSIVAEMAERIGGTWDIMSVPGKGTRALLFVP